MPTELIFDRPLSVELLQWLARGSLRQPDILAMAIRLWVILRSLYGGTDDQLYLESLSDAFGYPQWRDRFFIDANTQHRGDAIATIHHPNCPCHKTITDWLFHPDGGMSESQWRESFHRHYRLTNAEMDRVLDPTAWVYNPAGKLSPGNWKQDLQNRYQISPQELKSLVRIVRYPERELHKNRPFAVSRKSLKKDLKILADLGWLEIETLKREEKYRKVTQFPTLAISDRDRGEDHLPNRLTGDFLQSDLADFLENFASPINNIQRFYLNLEYIIPSQLSHQINTLQDQLKQIWSETPVPPIRLTYRSAKLYQEEVDRLVYPVCICYYQRAPYLFAYGQMPKEDAPIGWYDYRIERILSLNKIDWESPEIPPELKPFQKTPKLPQEAFDLMQQAWGFDFYQPLQEMLVWFDPYFYANYIEETERASWFAQMSCQDALNWLEKKAIYSQYSRDRKAQLKTILANRPPTTQYYRLNYRDDDNSVIMRLRSWGPNVEVLYPLKLRDKMRSDLETLYKKYSIE